MSLSAASRRDRAAADAEAAAAERLRSVRDRLEATASGLGELEYLRQRQEVLVRTALDLQVDEEPNREAQLSPEEKLLEDNILLLRKQLNCLRRRDAGLISQLQELDRQISDLRLDTETPQDQLETDSRPSSGFYELSDGASGSLSNSSNSVFSECFCSTADADARFPSADELPSCLDCDGSVGGLLEDLSSSGTVRRSLSAPHPPTLDAVSFVGTCDHQSRYHCDVVARNGSEVFRYPSPLHAVAVQSPVFLQMLGHGGHRREEGFEGLKPEGSSPTDCISAPHVPQSSSWPTPSSAEIPPHKRLDGYIYSLVQRRALPVRTSRPRTSISTDPSKSILRQASLCLRQGSSPSSGPSLGSQRGCELKPSWPVGGASTESASTSSPQRQWSMESKSEEQDGQNVFPDGSGEMVQHGFKVNIPDLAQNQSSSALNGIQNLINKDINTGANSLLKNKKPLLPAGASPTTLSKDTRELDSPKFNSPPKDSKQPCSSPDQEQLYKSPPAVKTQLAALKNNPKPFQTGQTEKVDRSALEITSLGSSSQSQDEAGGEGGGSHVVNAKYVSDQRQNGKLRKGGSKNAKVKTTATKSSRASESKEPTTERKVDKSQHRSSSRKSRHLDDGGSVHGKSSKRSAAGSHSHGASSCRVKRVHGSIPEGRVLDKHAMSTLGTAKSSSRKPHHHGKHHHTCSNHHHHGHQNQGRDQVVVVAKPKHKRNNYRRLRAIMEAPHDEALKRAQHLQKKEMTRPSAANVYHPSKGQMGSPYSYVAGSDSEYSAECASLFHSTIADTSEDERSNYTANRFGDSESSEEYVEESTTSDTEESGGGGAGGGTGATCRGRIGVAESRAAGQEMTSAQAKAFIKIKASHNLKRKILRFRSGSLKLMTTV
ncbi:dapper homolog 1 [Antennarius striatus]|uniref:dapper homolog 1 n=1 Tax=Antennarius striatus TaxID=241820 RepID=UPI0035AFD3DE